VNICYFIGNGFDLNLELQTSYKDFYQRYLKLESAKSSIKEFKENISGNLPKWSDLEFELGQYSSKINSTEDADDIHGDIVDSLANYLSEIELSLDSIKFDSNKFVDHLFQPENHLTAVDSSHLKQFYTEFGGAHRTYSIVSFNYTQTIEKILDIEQVRNSSTNLKIRRVYGSTTHTLSSLFHVHGTIQQDMVLGVDNIEQLSNISFTNDVDQVNQLIKPQCNRVMRHGVDLDSERVLKSSQLICIFGSSIGDTDKKWWGLVADKLREGKSRLVIFERNSNFNRRRSHLQDRLRREILKKFFEPEEIDELEKYVYISFNSDMFKLTER